jgi:16S rRNA (uracil1498-N3)-methyltransferase
VPAELPASTVTFVFIAVNYWPPAVKFCTRLLTVKFPMRIPRIYTTQDLSINEKITLAPSAGHYVANVLRMKQGRVVTLFNGEGGEYKARLDLVSKKSVSATVTAFTDVDTESSLQVELGVCIIKNDRMDWLFQKAAELGVSNISPLLSEHTDIKLPAERIDKKMKHWQQIIENACQQSGRTAVPTINTPQTLTEWVGQVQADYKCMLHPHDSAKINAELSPSTVALLVGPEGGLEEKELAAAVEAEFSAISLGPRILRAETAPLAALSVLQYQFGDI